MMRTSSILIPVAGLRVAGVAFTTALLGFGGGFNELGARDLFFDRAR
jgi:hypothetical protein